MNSRSSFGAALGLMQQSMQLAGAFLPGSELIEAQNKLEVFRLFAYVDQELNLPPSEVSLPDMIRRAQELPPFRRSFAFEGAAHYYTSRTGGTALVGLLADPALPVNAMVPMHSGMGNALANAALAGLGHSPAKDSLRRAIEGFYERCRANSRPGWNENAFEALGLLVRTLHPHLLRAASDVIGEIGGDADAIAQRLFWHGVGRALYFIPTNFIALGGSHQRALHSAFEETPTMEDRQNAIAGLAWALTMVNIRQPAILESFLKMCRGTTMSPAITNGVVSALMVWKHMIPDDADILAPYLLTSSPPLWRDVVAAPAVHAFATVFPALRDAALSQNPAGEPTIASLFRYHEWEMSVA